MTFPVSSDGDSRTTRISAASSWRNRQGGLPPIRTNNEAFRIPGSTSKPVPGVNPRRFISRSDAGSRSETLLITAGPFRKGDLLTNRNHSIFFRNDVPMRINGRVAKFGRDPVLQAFRDVVLKAFRLIMN